MELKFDFRILAVILVLVVIGAYVFLSQQPNPSTETGDQNQQETPEEPETEPEEPTTEPEEPSIEPEEPETEAPPKLKVQFTEVGRMEDIGSPKDVHVLGDYAYIADSYNELRVLEVIDPANPEEINSFNLLGSRRGQGVYYSEPYLYVADGLSMLILNVSDPMNPVEVGSIHTTGFALKIYPRGEIAYVADREGGLLIVNVSDPANPWLVSRYFEAGSVHVLDVVVSDDYAYVAMGGLGLRIVNVSDPTSPHEIGFYDTEGTAEAVQISGSILYLADGEDGLRVFDTSDSTMPREVGFFNASTGGYTKDVFLSGGYVYVGDGPSSLLQVIDASDPMNPELVGEYETLGYVWGIYISDQYVFVANGENGLLILHKNIS